MAKGEGLPIMARKGKRKGGQDMENYVSVKSFSALSRKLKHGYNIANLLECKTRLLKGDLGLQ